MLGRYCPDLERTSHITVSRLVGALASRPRMNSGNLRPTVASNDPGPAWTMKTDPDDPRSMPFLLRLLEKQLDKYIDDIKYVWSVTVTAMNR